MPKSRGAAARRGQAAHRGWLLAEEDAARRASARTLHRDVSSGLSGVLLQLATLERAPAAARPAIIERATVAIETCLRAARDVELALRPPLLEEAGLGPPLRWLAGAASVPLAVPDVIPRLGIALEGLVFGAVTLLLERALRGRRKLSVRTCDAALVITLEGAAAREMDLALAAARERLRGRARVERRTTGRHTLIVRVARGRGART